MRLQVRSSLQDRFFEGKFGKFDDRNVQNIKTNNLKYGSWGFIGCDAVRRCRLIITGLIPQSFQPLTQVKIAILSWYHNSGECAISCARMSVCFCSQSVGGASILLLTHHLQSCDWSRSAVRFVRLALNVFMQNDGDFVYVILLRGVTFQKTKQASYV